MSHHDPGAAGPRRARRRHAPARRGRGAVWLLAGGGVTVLGLAAALLAGGLGKGGGPRPSVEGGADGPPAMIQADPSDGTSGGSDSSTSSGGGATSVPGGTHPSASPLAKTTATVAPSGTATAAPASSAASPTAGPSATATVPDGGRPTKPGKGRGASKRPR
ncbi:hypothetical protein [Streptomyces vietnamensis]|uniref:Uncharacterized protein n=1 Tax=Streptomyces vietnamensis TaxID=362257 RepID=A0A0B5HYM5_9ACTN|nr:hypothetical protein [Streptomyces vietnamensis]AJF67030.1 hypothetical protein SVTN_24250 [Streptomyces vietnamensis]